jgi:hypothetical protein
LLHIRSKDQMGGLYTGIRPVHIYPASRMVSDYSGMMVQVRAADFILQMSCLNRERQGVLQVVLPTDYS